MITDRVSQWRTVEAEIASATPRQTASTASSLLLQRDSGIPVSAGSVQAGAGGQPRQALLAEPPAPPPRGVDTQPEFGDDEER